MDITLALGSGGSRGNAHVGVLRVLEREGFRVRAVAGTSAGGIVAAVYAAGYSPDEMEALFSKVDQSKLFWRTLPDGPGLLSLSGAEKLLEEFLGNRTFKDLKFPCSMAAVDIKAGREVILNQGRVVDAVLATIAVPGVFPPKLLGDVELVDGGVLDPVPVSVVRSLAPALPVVAVVLTPLMEPAGGMTRLPMPVPVPARIVRRLTQTRIAQTFNIFLSAVDVGERMITEMRLKIDDPEVIIRPDVSGIGLLDKVDVHAVVRLGEQAAEAALPELRWAVAWPNRLQRQLFPRR